MSERRDCHTPEKQTLQRGNPAKPEPSPFTAYAKDLPPITPPDSAQASGCTAHSPQRSPLSPRQNKSNYQWQRQSGSASRGTDPSSHWQHSIQAGSQPENSPAHIEMLFGSPLPHLPNSLQDTVHLALSPNRHTIQAGTFSPSPFHNLFHSPPGANLDDSPYHNLTHSTVRHSPVSAAAQHTAVQASRQAAVGQAQGQRGEQQNLSRPADALERTSTAMLIPMSAPANMKVKATSANSSHVERMPSFTSLTAGPPHKRQRCLQFHTTTEQENSSQEYDHSPSPSYSLQESHSNGAPASRHRSQTISASMSDQADELCSNANDQAVSVKQELPFSTQAHERMHLGSASRKVATSSAALPALAAAMGSHAPNAARSAASHAAAAAAAVTPVTSRHVSSQSGDQASHQSVLHPDTPNDAVTAMDDRRLSTSSTRYRRSQASALSGPKRCNCKKSKCLKLYCDCFAAGAYCQNCSCSCCMNTEENRDLIVVTRDQIRQRNPQAFDTKISKQRAMGADASLGQHLRGCNCKRSACRKKYCECFQAGVPCGPQCKCFDCQNCAPGGKDGPPRPPPSHPTGPPTAAQKAAHSQGPAKTSPGTPAVKATEASAAPRSASRQATGAAVALQAIKQESDRPLPAPVTRKRDPRSFRKRAPQPYPHDPQHLDAQQHAQEQYMQEEQHLRGSEAHMGQLRSPRGQRGSGWSGLSRSMSEGAAPQAWGGQPSSAQVLGNTHMVDGAFDISPLDPRQQIRHGSVKQEEHGDLQSVHSCGDAEYQGLDERYTYKQQPRYKAVSGGFSQLLTGQDNSQLVLVPFKGQPEQHRQDTMAMHGSSASTIGSGPSACDVRDSTQSAAGGGSAAPEPYQILMPVQMADGQMMALPADRAQFAPGTYLVPRSTVPAHADVTGMQYSMQGMEAEQMSHGQQPFLSNDSLLLQHYADMELGQAGGLRSLLQAEPNVTPTVNFDMDRAIVGDQLLMPTDMEEDVEQLIKGGPHELSMAADRLGNNLFGIHSGSQGGAVFSPPPLPWQTVAHHQQQPQQMISSPMMPQPSLHPPQTDDRSPAPFSVHRARRPPTGASPSMHGSPGGDPRVRRASLAQGSAMTPSQLRHRSMSADLERAELCPPVMTYPVSPSEQQTWSMQCKPSPHQSGPGFVRLNSGRNTVFSPNP